MKNLKTKLETAKRVNNELAEMIKANGGGATGQLAVMFQNASKDLMAIQNKIRNAFSRGEINLIEYKELTA